MTRRKGRSSSRKSKETEIEIAPLLPTSHSHGYKQYKHDRRREEPFIITNLKVGGVLAICLLFFCAIYSILSSSSSSSGIGQVSKTGESSAGVWSKYVTDDGVGGGSGEGVDGQDVEENNNTHEYPTFDLDEMKMKEEEIMYDAWGIAELYLNDQKPWDTNKKKFMNAATDIRHDFATMYGGEASARSILKLGLSTFQPTSNNNNKSDPTLHIPEGIRYTARRIVHAIQNKKKEKKKKTMKISFAGAAAVSGRGNYFYESFPSTLAEILTEPFEMLGITLEVRNAAMADIGIFPYGFCLDNFLGSDVDVVSFDPEMITRGDTTSSFEAYLRHAITMEHSPMFIMRETSYTESRRDMIQKYVDLGAMSDPLIFNIEAARAPFKDVEESILPPGFQDWLEFGGPDGAPGKTRANMSRKQHEFIGRMLSMYFLAAAELAMAHILKVDGLPDDILDIGPASKPGFQHHYLPKPQSDESLSSLSQYNNKDNDGQPSKNDSFMFGSKVPGDQNWSMNEVHCRTSFDPIIYGGLDEIIISGNDAEDINLLHPRGPQLYNKKWVLDMGPTAKQLASNIEQYDFEYQDRRKGYFGVRPSGNLTMFLPYELNDFITKYEQVAEKKSNELFKTVIVCQVNERADCQIDKDISFVLGGKPSKPQLLEGNGVSYSARKDCVSLSIPEDAIWSTRQKEGDENGGWLRSSSMEATGLSLSISVSNELLFWKDGPCSVSHVIWEQFRRI